MDYKEFDLKYNRRNEKGVITHTSVIDNNGNVVFSGTTEEVDNFQDNNFEKFVGNREWDTTNYSESNWRIYIKTFLS